MLNQNESNPFVMSRNPIDLRKGVDSPCGAIRSCHLDPSNGDDHKTALNTCRYTKLHNFYMPNGRNDSMIEGSISLLLIQLF